MDDQSKGSVDPKSNPGEENQGAPADMNVVSEIPPAVAHKKKTTHYKPDQTPLWKIIFEAGAIAVGITVAVIYYAQLGVMRRSSEIDQRAWLGVEAKAKPIAHGQPVTADLKITNFGKTPARHINGTFFVEVLKTAIPPTFDTSSVRAATGATVVDLFPGQINTPWTERERLENGQAVPWLLERTENDDLIEGHSYIAIHGVLNYEDVFHVKHWTEFCVGASYTKTPINMPTYECTKDHNREDDNDEP
jgi:hypothetical protein